MTDGTSGGENKQGEKIGASDLNELLCVITEVESFLAREMWNKEIPNDVINRIQINAIDKLDKARVKQRMKK